MRLASLLLPLMFSIAPAFAAAECGNTPWSQSSKGEHARSLVDAAYGPASPSSEPPLLPELMRRYSPEFQAEIADLVLGAYATLWSREVVSAGLTSQFAPQRMRSAHCEFIQYGLAPLWVDLHDTPLAAPESAKAAVASTDFSRFEVHERVAILEQIAITIELADRLADLESVWAEALLRLDNALRPRGRRMASERLQIEVASYVAKYRRAARQAAPLLLLHRYRDVSDEALEEYAARVAHPDVVWFGQLDSQMALERLRDWLKTNEGKLGILLEAEKRRALGLGEPRPVVTTAGKAGVDELIGLYGKDVLVDFVLAYRNARISVMVGELKTYFGRPKPKHVTSRTLLHDLRQLGLSIPQSSRALARFELHRSADAEGYEFWASPTLNATHDLFPKKPVVRNDSWSLAKVASRERKRAQTQSEKQAAQQREEAAQQVEVPKLKKRVEQKATEHVTRWLKLPPKRAD